MRTARGFDRLARPYRILEYAAFGRDLERARFAHLGALRDCRSVLVLGDGDGRGLARLAGTAAGAAIRSVDASARMVALARARLAPFGARVAIEEGDARTAALPPARYDGAVTQFFLDCFPPEEARALMRRVAASLAPAARWLWCDFALPPRGPARLRARLWVGLLYRFFRWETGIRARSLPPCEEEFPRLGFRREAARDFQWGLVRSAVYRRVEEASATSEASK